MEVKVNKVIGEALVDKDKLILSLLYVKLSLMN